MIHLSIDLETYSDVNLKKAGLYRYVQSPAFEILLFAYSLDGAPTQVVDMAQGEKIPLEVVHALTDPQCLKHAYNAAFEWYCLSKYMGVQLPPSQWRDTMLHGLYAGYTAGLDATGRALGIPEDKQKLAMEDYRAAMEGIYTTSVCRNTLDEAPQAYKPMDEILSCISDTVTVLQIIKPVYNFKAGD